MQLAKQLHVMLLVCIASIASAADPLRPTVVHDDFDVIIAGGSTAAFASAVSSAESGARTCLIEPTDWVGGQLTSSAVPAVDEAWHRVIDPKTKAVLVDVSAIARLRANMTPNFRKMLDETGNPGHGWVSNYCFEPREFLERQLVPLERKLVASGRLVVFRNTVVKQVETDQAHRRVVALDAIERRPKSGLAMGGYDVLPSVDLPDWYRPEDSPRFTKVNHRFQGRTEKTPVFIDATEWGEVLVLSDAPYLQGIESRDGAREGDDRRGQSTVFDLVQKFNETPVDEPAGPNDLTNLGFGDYVSRADAWSRIWTYRRIKSKQGGAPAPGDLCLQNWGYSMSKEQGGNDYPFGYLFVSKADAKAERNDWRGGIDFKVMAAAEHRAIAWHYWFKAHAPEGIDPRQISLDREALGTTHGLGKLPYIRDTRRSIGVDGFILTVADLMGPTARKTGKPFYDRVALGAYPADIHPMTGPLPAYLREDHTTLPFYIPFRALTNERYDNLLVAGKTMAQSFLANAATRLHPIEWSSGTAAGVAAADMARKGRTSRQELENITELQAQVRVKTPIDWTIDGRLQPALGTEARD